MHVDRVEYAQQNIIICPLPACAHKWCKSCHQTVASSEERHRCRHGNIERLMKRKGWKYCPGSWLSQNRWRQPILKSHLKDVELPYRRNLAATTWRYLSKLYSNLSLLLTNYTPSVGPQGAMCEWLTSMNQLHNVTKTFRSHFCYKCGVLMVDTTNGGDVGTAVTDHYTQCRLFEKKYRCSIQWWFPTRTIPVVSRYEVYF